MLLKEENSKFSHSFIIYLVHTDQETEKHLPLSSSASVVL